MSGESLKAIKDIPADEPSTREQGFYWLLMKLDENKPERWTVAWWGQREGESQPYWFFPGRDGPYGQSEVEEFYVKAGYLLKISPRIEEPK